MSNTKATRVAVALVTLSSLGFAGGASAAKDSFTIRCTEAYDVDPTKGEPVYICKVKVSEGPKKVKDFPSGDQDVDNIVLSIVPGGGQLGPRACPGWFFINGKWVYDSTPPCPGVANGEKDSRSGTAGDARR